MSNDLDKYSGGGDLDTYSSPLQPLAPSPDTWGQVPADYLTPREISDYQKSGEVRLFGEPMPGATQQQIEQAIGEISGVFLADMSRLKHPVKFANAAIAWLQQNATQPPRHEPKNHRYNMHDQANDPLMMSFCNAMQRVGASQEFVSNTLWWLGQLEQHLNAQGSHEAPRTATPTASDPTENLTEAQYQQVVKANQQAQSDTYTYLKNLWHDSFDANLRMTNSFYASLPIREQVALDKYTTGWIHALNTKEVILGLYRQAIGSNSLPTGGALSTEIAEHERVMKYDRKRWNSDERLQARYRTLLDLRDKR